MGTVFVGIDPTAGHRPMNYAILDADLRLQTRGLGTADKVLEVVRGYPSAFVAVDAPQSPNHGLMAQPDFREKLGLPPKGKTWRNCKVCEFELRRRGIRLYLTPGEAEAAPKWMQVGFQLYEALRAEGYVMHTPGLAAPRQIIEVHPHGCYTVLLGHVPYSKNSMEGRLQRQAVLFREGINVPDPIDTVEEITRHHLLQGTLDLPGLLTHDELDALAAAYTAYLAAQRPEQVSFVGDAAEGQIALPVAAADFKDLYR